MAFKGTPGFTHQQPDQIGILLTNLGTPDAPDSASVRHYLAEFLADPRIVEMPRWLWRIILHGVILRIRPPRVAHAYASVWREDGSPLLAYTRKQARALQPALEATFRQPLKVAVGMRYGNPSLAEGLAELQAAGVRRILVLPLYPQYSATTTASTFDAIADELKTWRWLPELHMLTSYHDHPGYISALANSVQQYQQQHGTPQKLLFSFHGLPKRYLLAGDPYFCQCHKTARLVAEQLGLPDDAWQVTFQSRFGREEWLQPYTDMTLKALPGEGIRHVQVISPGFSSDCLETLEEIDMQNREFFLEAGGERFDYIPALNDSPEHIRFLAELVSEHTKTWQTLPAADTAAREQLAKKEGAGQ
ncbi:MAG: ferrochelatase [Pseudomonadota bacterium]|nr:ferrochelatase [Pseudomonadota bacterium]